MQVARIHVENFRGVKDATLDFAKHSVFLGDNNTGKTTILEALDLVLGPDRLNRTPPIDEHDFYLGEYAPKSETSLPKDQGEGEAQEGDAETPKSGPSDGSGAEMPAEESAPKIQVDVTIIDLSEEQCS